jgi:hypothetical protein
VSEKTAEDREFVFFLSPPAAAAAVADSFEAEDEETKPQGKRIEALKSVFGAGKRVPVKDSDVRTFLAEQVVPLGDTIAEEAAKTGGGYHVDEITFSLGVTLEGNLFFVAKASAQATVEVTLRKG